MFKSNEIKKERQKTNVPIRLKEIRWEECRAKDRERGKQRHKDSLEMFIMNGKNKVS